METLKVCASITPVSGIVKDETTVPAFHLVAHETYLFRIENLARRGSPYNAIMDAHASLLETHEVVPTSNFASHPDVGILDNRFFIMNKI
jgi:hypothetical protein